MMLKQVIRRRVFMGDSLSDRGTLDHLKLLGFIPMSVVAGLAGKSPRGRFTNGFLWVDMLGACEIGQLVIDYFRHLLRLEDNAVDNADLADRLICDPQLLEINQRAFTLNDDRNIMFHGKRFIRSYCEGGATAADWSDVPTTSLIIKAQRLIVSHLSAKRKQLFRDDKKYRVSITEKEETLVTEWSGANDLITVNSEPTREAADRAVTARIANIEQLIKNGYKHFVLMNLPDLGIAPKYQKQSPNERDNATACSVYFNQQITAQVEKLRAKYANLQVFIDVFDVFSLLNEVYTNPTQYGFDQEKINIPYTSSEQFKQNADNIANQAEHLSPAQGYMFWDDVHPTATLHAWLAERYMDRYESYFVFKSPTTEPSSQAKSKAFREIQDQYGLDVCAKLANQEQSDKSIPSRRSKLAINIAINKIKIQERKLHNGFNTIAREKAKVLKQLLNQIETAWSTLDLEALNEILNAEAGNPAFAIHQNLSWDKFWKKDTTRTEDLLRNLQLAVNDALNLPLASLST